MVIDKPNENVRHPPSTKRSTIPAQDMIEPTIIKRMTNATNSVEKANTKKVRTGIRQVVNEMAKKLEANGCALINALVLSVYFCKLNVSVMYSPAPVTNSITSSFSDKFSPLFPRSKLPPGYSISLKKEAYPSETWLQRNFTA